MKSIAIDIIVPTRNAQQTLSQCIDSLLALQCEGPSFRLIPNILVINNASSDNTETLLQNLKVPYLNHSKVGRSQARNYGIKSTTSPYVAFIDADVMLPKNWLVEMMQFLINHPHFAAGESRINPVHDVSNVFTKAQVTKLLDESLLPRFERDLGVGLNSCACIYLRSALISNHGFDEKLNSFEDLDLAHRVFYNKGNLFSLNHLEVRKIVSTKNALQYFLREYSKGFYFHKLHKKRQQSVSFDLWKIKNHSRMITLRSRLNRLEFIYVSMLFFAAFNLGLSASIIVNLNYGKKTHQGFYSDISFNNKLFGILFLNSTFWCYNPQEKSKIKISEALMKSLYKDK
jgi:glycosyltransferase involved in cell wall biosynthesis